MTTAPQTVVRPKTGLTVVVERAPPPWVVTPTPVPAPVESVEVAVQVAAGRPVLRPTPRSEGERRLRPPLGAEGPEGPVGQESVTTTDTPEVGQPVTGETSRRRSRPVTDTVALDTQGTQTRVPPRPSHTRGPETPRPESPTPGARALCREVEGVTGVALLRDGSETDEESGAPTPAPVESGSLLHAAPGSGARSRPGRLVTRRQTRPDRVRTPKAPPCSETGAPPRRG